MLKVDKIKLTDAKNREYEIHKNQIELFPLAGGEEAEMIYTKVWNQHGNSHVNAFMETFDGEIRFRLITENLRPNEIAEARRQLTNICNPLNGVITLSIYLNNGLVFNRDITFYSAPIFPIGFKNRNQSWQKVQLLYTANNPFWYSEAIISESFQGSNPLFEFPFSSATFTFGEVIPNKIAINEGQVEAPVVIKIEGACINPIITNETTNEFIQFKDLTMGANDVLLIDTHFGKKKVELNGENVFHKLDFKSSFFNLAIGENSIDFSDDSGSTSATINFIYKNLYITL